MSRTPTTFKPCVCQFSWSTSPLPLQFWAYLIKYTSTPPTVCPHYMTRIPYLIRHSSTSTHRAWSEVLNLKLPFFIVASLVRAWHYSRIPSARQVAVANILHSDNVRALVQPLLWNFNPGILCVIWLWICICNPIDWFHAAIYSNPAKACGLWHGTLS